MIPTCDAFTRMITPVEGVGKLSAKRVAVKDNIDVAGLVSAAGCPEWGQSRQPAQAHAAVVAQLLARGAHLVGKTQMDTLAYGLMGENARLGTPPNPAALGRVPGGSSSGSASAVAAGAADIGVGTDTAGSIRLPAAFCGVVGWRPSQGLIPMTGVLPLAPSFDVVGFFTRDLPLMGEVIDLFAPKPVDHAPQCFLPQDLWDLVPPALAAHIRAGLPPAHLPSRPLFATPDGVEACFHAFRTCQSYEITQQFGPWIRQTRPEFDPALRARFDLAASITKAQHDSARADLERISETLATALEQGAVAVFPTLPGIAPPCNTPAIALEGLRNASLRLLSVASAAGLAQVTLPFGRWQGAPVGLSFMAARGQDALLPRACQMLFAESTHQG